MSLSSIADIRALLALVLIGCSGCCCTHWCHLPDDCAHAFRCTQLGWEVHDVCCRELCAEGCDCGDCCCGVHVCDEAVVIDEPCCRRKCRLRLAAGPPPEPYKPPMPPKFLPVPACSVFSPVNPGAPTLTEGQVEVGYGHKLVFPAGD